MWNMTKPQNLSCKEGLVYCSDILEGLNLLSFILAVYLTVYINVSNCLTIIYSAS